MQGMVVVRESDSGGCHVEGQLPPCLGQGDAARAPPASFAAPATLIYITTIAHTRCHVRLAIGQYRLMTICQRVSAEVFVLGIALASHLSSSEREGSSKFESRHTVLYFLCA